VFQVKQGIWIRISSELAHLSEHLQDGIQHWSEEADTEAYLRHLADAVNLAKLSECRIEEWLLQEEYEFADGIEIDMEAVSPQELRLKPKAKDIDDPKLQSQLVASEGKRSVFTAPSSRNRRRLVLTEPQRDILQEFSQSGNKTLTGAQVPLFLEEPQAFLPEGIDLSDFSERVKGLQLRVYNSRPYIHFRPEKLSWIPEVGVKLNPSSVDSEDSDTEFPSEMTPEELIRLGKEARKSGDRYIYDPDRNAWIEIDPDVTKQFEEAQDRIKSLEEHPPEHFDARYIFEIFENLDELEFSIDEPGAAAADLEAGPKIIEHDAPSLFRGEFRPFQRIGYSWLRTIDGTLRGGLLADDMGLGKTIQAIGLMAARKEAGTLAPSLLVVPKSLIENWEEEIGTFCPDLRRHILLPGPCPAPSFFEGYDLTICSYDTLRRHQITLGKVPWSIVLCDEAQYVKNPTTGRTTALKALKADMSLALTGTPVENGLSELWCIFDFVRPGLLGSLKEFRQNWETPIVRAGSEDDRATASRALLGQIRHNYLRRLKEDVLELPDKHENELICDLSPFQMELYADVIHEAREGGRGKMLAALQKLLMICAYPWGLNGSLVPNDGDPGIQCPKLAHLLSLLDTIKGRGEKVLIFLDRIRVQYALQEMIWNRYGISPSVLNGDMTFGRQQAVKVFNGSSGFNVMILSPKVGGTGLNITSANHVIHYMRPWNPAIENQATDRTYRIGQEKEVTVYTITSQHPEFKSVELVLNELLEQKRGLAKDVLIPSAQLSVSEQELMAGIFGLST